ncbi:endo-1,4-beta-xylanase [Nocardiopsis sp. HNM0947]|uniref:Beta-xylanase n=1 Tax=Nocardiopsis coralli TaxID=2772213 RepID=A0ABR9P5V2_9ACTN|nr:endo-1,4-beta-xylanase [Nocardiopsis coralli]MBE2999228.1 endo-1,4-beta-xylanase [Nocardiopsis coralli]
MPRPRLTTSLTATAAAVPLALLPISPVAVQEAAQDTLRDAAPEGFHIGSSVAGGGHHDAEPYPDPFTHDEEYTDVLAREFASLTPENRMKWSEIHPAEGSYDFDAADRIVEFAEANGQEVRGHALLWHDQNPDWLEEGDHTEGELREILRDHVTTVVGRYEGRVHQWDVGNELIGDDNELRTEENFWLRELGPEIIGDVFRWAHEADPAAELFLNDYNVEDVNDKSDAYLALVEDLLADGVPVHGFSAQAHLSTAAGYPGSLEENLDRFGDLGLRTALSEVDVRVETPHEGAGATEEQLAEQSDFYTRALQACLDAESCTSFTVWSFTDRYSWIPIAFPGEGAGSIMDDDLNPKPAYDALRETLQAHTG